MLIESIHSLKELHELVKDGVITQSDFNAKKREVLNSVQPVPESQKIKTLQELHGLLKANIITQDDFDSTKSFILNNTAPEGRNDGQVSQILREIPNPISSIQNMNPNLGTPSYNPNLGPKDWTTTLLLNFFLGWLGIHRFYTGHTVYGVIQLFTGGGCGIWWFIDFIQILTNSYKDANGNDLVKK